MALWRKVAAIAMFGAAMWPTVALSRLPIEVSSAPIPTLGELHAVAAPIAFRLFCIRSPEQCRPSWVSSVPLSISLFRLVGDINRDVNRSIRPRRERIDLWSIDVKVGDCEDFALTKRAHLLAAGVEPGALRIATAKTSNGEGHAVLIVRTNRGDLVLDNRFDTIRFATAASLEWVSMSSSNPLSWFAVTARS